MSNKEKDSNITDTKQIAVGDSKIEFSKDGVTVTARVVKLQGDIRQGKFLQEAYWE